jgi:hypothetical protein
MALLPLSRWDALQDTGHLYWLIEHYTRLTYDMLRLRILQAPAESTTSSYDLVPHGFQFTLNFDGLVAEADYTPICEELWQKVLDEDTPHFYAWVELFQSAVLRPSGQWLDRFEVLIQKGETESSLLRLTALLSFDGSMIIINCPKLTRAFLLRAEAIGGASFVEQFRTRLYTTAGPKSWSFSGGERDSGYGYLEVEAQKAAQAHADDNLLGPFYRKIAEWEERDRQQMRLRYEADRAEMDL